MDYHIWIVELACLVDEDDLLLSRWILRWINAEKSIPSIRDLTYEPDCWRSLAIALQWLKYIGGIITFTA